MRKILAVFVSFLGLYFSHISSSFISNLGVFSFKQFKSATHCFICLPNLLFVTLVSLIVIYIINKYNFRNFNFKIIFSSQLLLFYFSQAVLLISGEAHYFSPQYIVVVSITLAPISYLLTIILKISEYIINKILKKLSIKKDKFSIKHKFNLTFTFENYILTLFLLRSPPLTKIS